MVAVPEQQQATRSALALFPNSSTRRSRRLATDFSLARALLPARTCGAASGAVSTTPSTRRESLGGTDLQDTVARFSREVARYARMIAASVDVTDLVMVARFRSAVSRSTRSARAAAARTTSSRPTPSSSP